MIKKKKKIIIGISSILSLLLLMVLWIFRPSPSYDINAVDNRLQKIQFPLKAVESSYYLDGGSIGIVIQDNKDNIIKLAVPVESTGYGNLYIGTLHISETPGIIINNQDESKKMLFSILENNRSQWNTFALVKLRSRWKDYIRLIIHKIYGDFDENKI